MVLMRFGCRKLDRIVRTRPGNTKDVPDTECLSGKGKFDLLEASLRYFVEVLNDGELSDRRQAHLFRFSNVHSFHRH